MRKSKFIVKCRDRKLTCNLPGSAYCTTTMSLLRKPKSNTARDMLDPEAADLTAYEDAELSSRMDRLNLDSGVFLVADKHSQKIHLRSGHGWRMDPQLSTWVLEQTSKSASFCFETGGLHCTGYYTPACADVVLVNSGTEKVSVRRVGGMEGSEKHDPLAHMHSLNPQDDATLEEGRWIVASLNARVMICVARKSYGLACEESAPSKRTIQLSPTVANKRLRCGDGLAQTINPTNEAEDGGPDSDAILPNTSGEAMAMLSGPDQGTHSLISIAPHPSCRASACQRPVLEDYQLSEFLPHARRMALACPTQASEHYQLSRLTPSGRFSKTSTSTTSEVLHSVHGKVDITVPILTKISIPSAVEKMWRVVRALESSESVSEKVRRNCGR